MNSKNLSHLLILSMVAGLCFGYVIESPRKTNWGVWGDWARCPTNQFVVGMQLKVEEYQGYFYDDTALNGIKFFCAPLDDLMNMKEIVVLRSDGWGDWKSKKRCGGSIATGFELKGDGPQPGNGDDTAASNVRLFCTGGKEVEGDGLTWGEWTGPQNCDDGYGICGIKAQIEPYQGRDFDDTGLNNIQVECCKIPSPATTCFPTDSWIPIQSCSNQLSDDDIQCSYDLKVGLSTSKSSSQESYLQTQATASLETTMKATSGVLSASFTANVGISKTTGFNWGQSSSETWSSESTQHLQVPVKAGKNIRIDQVKGICGPYTVSASKYRVIEI